MNAKVISIIIVILALAAGLYFSSKPITKGLTSKKETHSHNEDAGNSASGVEQSYSDFLAWKENESPDADALDKKLTELAAQYPSDYRFTLERVRGAANVKGVHSHTEGFEILEEAARKAIACKCGDANKMRNDLLANKDDKIKGFWKLSTHPKQWDMVVEALENKDASQLAKNEEHHH